MTKLPIGWRACFVSYPEPLIQSHYDVNKLLAISKHVQIGRSELRLSYLYKGFPTKSRHSKRTRHQFPLWRIKGDWNITSQYDINIGFSTAGNLHKSCWIFARLYKGVGRCGKPFVRQVPENWKSFIHKHHQRRWGGKFEDSHKFFY
jgi:hypothetical protein